MKKIHCFYILFFLFIGITNNSFSQDLIDSDLSEINFLELNSSQIDLVLRRASSKGLTQLDLIKIAESQGLSEKEIQELKTKFQNSVELKRIGSNNSSPIENSRLRAEYEEEMKIISETDSDIFGFNIFKPNSLLTFQSNINAVTPLDYILGPGDNLYVDIFGESESYFNVQISPEGEAIFENIGPVNLNGITVKNAKRRLVSRFSSLYTGLLQNRTFMNVSVGNPRKVQINVVGEVNIPGTYNLSALNTVYNAIYAAGGINENATLRDIKVFRNNKLISSVDIYKYLKYGKNTSNVRLENNDLILVGPYTERVSIDGEIKISGKFELKKGETLKDLLSYAGGFKERAYTNTIKVERVNEGELMVFDVKKEEFTLFKPQIGDKFTIEKVLDKYTNRIIVEGAVQRPGVFSLTKGMTVNDAIAKADGLKSDAFLDRAYITRTNKDFSTSKISFNLSEYLEGNNSSIDLFKEDVITIISKSDLNKDEFVSIVGEVKNPGVYPYSKNISLYDLILIAGGYNSKAISDKVEITRRISENSLSENNISEIIEVNISERVENLTEIKLEPFDEIIVRRNPNFYSQKFVVVEGQIRYPGKYAISSFDDKISTLVNRGGGVKNFAYLKGATLIRKSEIFEDESEKFKEIKSLIDLRKKLNKDSKIQTESDKILLNKINSNIENLEIQKDEKVKDISNFAKTERINDILKRNSLTGEDITIGQYEAIGINLEEILKNPGSESDLLIEEGDILIIPKKQETVRLRGKLLYPNTVRYKENKTLKYYTNSAGGFDMKAKRSGTYVVYANGDVSRTKKFLFFNFYPKVEPGSEIIVPAKSIKGVLGVNQILNYTTGLATLILAITQIK